MSIRMAVLGCGAWGQNHVRVWNELGCLSAVCDPDLARLTMATEIAPGVRTTQHLQDILDDKDIDAVTVATPAVTHADLSQRAMRAGKDVLVEKPMALTTEEGRELLETAATTTRMLAVGHVLEYHPAVAKLKELVDAGELGKVQYIYATRLNLGRIRTEENALWSFAPHDIAILLRLLGEFPTRLSCHGDAYLSRNVADVTMTNLLFPGGERAHIFVSWLHPFKEHRFVVVGEKRMAVFDDTEPWENKLVLYEHRVEWVGGDIPVARRAEAVQVPLAVAEPLAVQAKAVMRGFTDRTDVLTDGASGLRVLEVLRFAQTSLEADGEVIEAARGRR